MSLSRDYEITESIFNHFLDKRLELSSLKLGNQYLHFWANRITSGENYKCYASRVEIHSINYTHLDILDIDELSDRVNNLYGSPSYQGNNISYTKKVLYSTGTHAKAKYGDIWYCVRMV